MLGEPTDVLIEVSPHGTLEAVVEQDDRVAYFYLRPLTEGNFALRSCWLGNLRRAPWRLDVEGMKRGVPPMLPRKYCRNRRGRAPLDRADLEVVWLPEGDGAILLEGEAPLAVIPAWSGTKGFDGYSRDCKEVSPLCWAIEPAEEVVSRRLANAREYWESWSESSSLWPGYQRAYLDVLEGALGSHERYFAIDEGRWPPKAAAVFGCGAYKVIATIGVGLVPQPQVELAYEDPIPHRRFELALGVASDLSEEELRRCLSYVSGQTKLPWHDFTFLASGHTVPCDSMPKGTAGQEFPAVLLLSAPRQAPEIAVPRVFDEPVNLLWMVPITHIEREFAMKESSNALGAKLAKQPTAWRSGGR